MSSKKRLPTAERRVQIAEAALRIICGFGVRRLTSAALAEQVGIADAQKRGEITSDTSLTLLVWMVVGVIRGASTVQLQRITEAEDLLSATPEQVWASLERFLRTTSKENLL